MTEPNSARELVDAVHAGEYTAERGVERSLNRIRALNPLLNAMVATFPGRAFAAARKRRSGPLSGLPVVLKDTFSLPWRSPHEGAGISPGVVGRGASDVYVRLRDAGAIIVGVSHMHQLGMGSTGLVSADGPCLNPWDATRAPGGSSSGSAVAVASGIVPTAVGTDGAGSIRIPAAYCGLVGLKPTFGLVPSGGYTGASSTMTAIGPIARDTRDCRLLLEGLLNVALPSWDRPFRIGLVEGDLWSDVDPLISSRCMDALNALVGDGTTLRAVRLDGLEHVLIAAATQLTVERLPSVTPSWLGRMSGHLDARVRGGLLARALATGNLVARIARVRCRLRREISRAFDEVDVLAWPTVPSIAPPIERTTLDLPSGTVSVDAAAVRHCGVANLTGIPAISVPVGLVRGMPAGLMLQAPWGADGTLLEIAEQLERATAREFVGLRPLICAGA